jgi:methionyl-tRNA synthetase
MRFGLLGSGFMGVSAFAAFVILLIAIWSIVWKGFALWIAAKEEKKWWFIPILFFNTAGILEIIYIFFFSVAGKKFLQDVKQRRAYKKSNKKSKHIAEQVEDIDSGK